jgi:steroid delta-isomerase-like uncharacterized protein
MSVDSNKALVRRFYEEAWNGGRFDVIDEAFADDYVRHDLRPTEAAPGPAGQRAIVQAFRNAFPDLRFEVALLVGEGEFVVGRWTASGTHTGPWGGIEPTGKTANLTAVNIFRFETGKVVELWNYRDDLGFMEQLGERIYGGAEPQ